MRDKDRARLLEDLGSRVEVDAGRRRVRGFVVVHGEFLFCNFPAVDCSISDSLLSLYRRFWLVMGGGVREQEKQDLGTNILTTMKSLCHAPLFSALLDHCLARWIDFVFWYRGGTVGCDKQNVGNDTIWKGIFIILLL